jgi:hypothetical protein
MRGVWPSPNNPADPWDEWGEPQPTRLEAARRSKGAPPEVRVPTLAEMVGMGTDIDPGLTETARDLFLGPWGDALDRSSEAHQHAAAMATAAMVFSLGNGLWRPVWRDWARRTPRPCPDARAGFRAIDKAPFQVLKVAELPPGCRVAWVFPSVPSPSDVALSRRVGAEVPIAFGFPPHVPFGLLRRHAETRLREVSSTLDPVRRGGQMWVRRCYEWAWLHG